ncbi:MAG: hypothetical protein K1X57_16190 [Gemmataceae bacterium]|nr:hypothetical protein [Gemmataceae bacterium]
MTETMERTVELSPTLRALVDERLDGIERALRSANMPRVDRLRVVEDVERQLLDMLAETGDRPGRREVLQALAKLDPPEAYLADDSRPAAPVESPSPVGRSLPVSLQGYSQLAVASLAALLFTLFCVVFAFMCLVARMEGLFLAVSLIACLGAMTSFGLGIAAVISLRREPRRGSGFAAVSVVTSAWILALTVTYGIAVMFSSEGMGVLMLVLKDLPFGVALIWLLRGALKSAAVVARTSPTLPSEA